MSIIGVKYHNEDIHNIISKPESMTIKSPRYRAKQSTHIPFHLREKLKYNGHQTFGLAHYEIPQASNYLKKGKPKIEHPALKLLDRSEFKCTNDQKNPPVPKSCASIPQKLSKNFVKENIKKIANIEPKVPRPRKVDTPRGTVKEMAHLIQMIKIRQSDEYGKIPKYLRKRKRLSEKYRRGKEEQLLAVSEYKKKMGIGSMGMSESVYMVDQETRAKLLEGLKENWNELSKQFLRLPVMSDTLTKIKRKMWLEKEIDQLERDVKLVESHPYIYLERHDPRPIEVIIAEERKLNEMKAGAQKEQENADAEKSVNVSTSQELRNDETNAEGNAKGKSTEQFEKQETEEGTKEKGEKNENEKINENEAQKIEKVLEPC